jgi:hypothetical protein
VPGSDITPASLFFVAAGLGAVWLVVSFVQAWTFPDMTRPPLSDADDDPWHPGRWLFGTRAPGLILMTGGFVAAAANLAGFTAPESLTAGCLAGLVLAWMAYVIARAVERRSWSDGWTDETPVGVIARVISAIPAGGQGRVRFRMREHLLERDARSAAGEAIDEHTLVRIDASDQEALLVTRWSDP